MRRPDPSAIPPGPGVYLYRDAAGEVVYVGKARALRRRVLSYFRPEGLAPKTKALMARAESVEFLAATTEKEAFLLEASLIKKHRPRYNILLRDDKQYALFRVNLKAPFPRIEIVRRAGKDGARYFGPFTSALAARETWKLLHRAFPLRRCADRAMRNRVRPCLYHSMGQCLAPCTGKVAEEDYLREAEAAVRVLDGKSDALLKELEEAMLEASERLEFERAAALRDQMRAVRQTVERQAAVLPGGGDMDAVGLSPSDKGLALAVVFVRQGAVQGGRAYFWPGLTFGDASELLWSFLGQFYAEFMPPERILLPWMPLDAEEAEDGEYGGEDGVDGEAAEGGTGNAGKAGGAACTALSGADAGRAEVSGYGVAPGLGTPCGKTPGGVPELASAKAPDQASGQALRQAAEGFVAGAAQEGLPGTVAETAEPSHAGAELSQGSCAVAASSPSSSPSPAHSSSAGGLAREAMEQTLAERRSAPVRIVAPQNAQDNRLVDIAAANAREEARLRERGGMDAVLAKIGQALGLAATPSRIECVDVSHTGGSATRVGLVVWTGGLHKPEQSRAYALEGTGGDDYKALHAWAARRIESGPPWPDLLLIDGGRGQIASVARGLADAGRPGLFPLAGIAKARDGEGHADRRAGNVADRIFLPGRSDALVSFRDGSPELLFLQNVRDSAHRFAISRHRRARGKAALQGELIRLQGIGPATARLLWDAFGSIEAMRRASLAELEKLPGIGPAKARGIHACLHGEASGERARDARHASAGRKNRSAGRARQDGGRDDLPAAGKDAGQDARQDAGSAKDKTAVAAAQSYGPAAGRDAGPVAGTAVATSAVPASGTADAWIAGQEIGQGAQDADQVASGVAGQAAGRVPERR